MNFNNEKFLKGCFKRKVSLTLGLLVGFLINGEIENDRAFENKYNFMQLGYDRKYEKYNLGGAIGYNEGESTFAHGSSDTETFSLWLYGTYLNTENSSYTDVVLKMGKLKEDYEVTVEAGTAQGDSDTNGLMFSIEHGREFAGNIQAYFDDGKNTNSYYQKLRDTWTEVGLGFDKNLKENLSLYGEVNRTLGGEFETPWEVILGFKWEI